MSLRGLLPRVIAEGGRNDILALQQVDWPGIDGETLTLAADAAIDRADREITSRSPGDWMIGGLISALGGIGTSAGLPLVQANHVLDCLHRLGRTVPRANSVAATVERALRAREISRDR